MGSFFVGFYHGKNPEIDLSYHYRDVVVIDILVQDQKLLPTNFIQYLEKEYHLLIKVIEKNKFDEFRTELIINKNIYLAFVPENFIQPLYKENRIKNLDTIKTEIEDAIYIDFLPKKLESKYFSLPTHWFINVFLSEIDPTISPIKLKTIFLDRIKQQSPKKIVKNNSIKFQPGKFLETTLQQASQKGWKYVLDPDWSYLMIYSWVIPNNTPNRDLSLKILKKITSDTICKDTLQSPFIGHTFKMETSTSITLHNSPESIRNINLNSIKKQNEEFDEKLWK